MKPQNLQILAGQSVTLKLILIGFLAIILLIPTFMIQSTIVERAQLNEKTVDEIGSKWAGSQTVSGPILSILLIYEIENEGKLTKVVKQLFLLPERLLINGEVVPKELERGIYKAIVYRSNLDITGDFIFPRDFDQAGLISVLASEATLSFGISDLIGVEDEIKIKLNEETFDVIPGSVHPHLFPSGFHLNKVPLSIENKLNFKIDLILKGSENLEFLPLGRITEVNLKSNWAKPKFDGRFLPLGREVSPDGFEANWKVLEINRNYPQHWIDKEFSSSVTDSAFGVELLALINDYQKIHRTTNYALLTIALTFLVFFLVETIGNRRIHPFQYTVVGLAICLFYALLLSISEFVAFNAAYWFSAGAIISLISLYSIPLFQSRRYSMVLCGVLIISFGFIFIILQLQDLALLIGTLGLLVILSLTMYLTRNINWYAVKGIHDGAVSTNE